MDSGLSLLRDSQARLVNAARPILKGDLDSMADQFVEMDLAKQSFAAGVKLIQTQQETYESLLDIFA